MRACAGARSQIALLYDFGLGEGVDAVPLTEPDPDVLLLEGHLLAEGSAVTLEALAAEPLVSLDLEPSRDYFLSLFGAQGLAPRIGQRTRSLEMVRGLVGHGLGYSPARDQTGQKHAL